MKHTPLPWIAHGKTIKDNIVRERTTVARADSRGKFRNGYDEANAEFIVQACNNHYELLEALKEAVKELRPRLGNVRKDFSGINMVENTLCKAIRRAEGKN